MIAASHGEQAGTRGFNYIRLIVVWQLWRLMSICHEKPGVLLEHDLEYKNKITLALLVDVTSRSSCDHLVLRSSIVGHRKKFLALHDTLKDPNTAPQRNLNLEIFVTSLNRVF